MNKREIKIFGTIAEIFGEKTSQVMYNLYIDFIHDMKMFGIIFSIPVKFVQFFRESYKKQVEQSKNKKS